MKQNSKDIVDNFFIFFNDYSDINYIIEIINYHIPDDRDFVRGVRLGDPKQIDQGGDVDHAGEGHHGEPDHRGKHDQSGGHREQGLVDPERGVVLLEEELQTVGDRLQESLGTHAIRPDAILHPRTQFPLEHDRVRTGTEEHVQQHRDHEDGEDDLDLVRGCGEHAGPEFLESTCRRPWGAVVGDTV